MIEGACHCGNVRWSFEGDPGAATACNCTICRRYGVLWIYDFENERIRACGRTTVYSWGPRAIGFHFCPECGCVAYWRGIKPREDGRRRMAVNVRLAEPEAVAPCPSIISTGWPGRTCRAMGAASATCGFSLRSRRAL